MSDLWLEIVNSNWQGHTGEKVLQDQLLEPEWIQHIIKQSGISSALPPTAEEIRLLQSLRALLQRIIEAFSTKNMPDDADIAALNIYLGATPATLHLRRQGEEYRLERLPLQSDERWLPCEVAASFASFITSHNSAWIKRCNNPACRWIYYDESRQRNQIWCNDRCANLMRVRRFRATHKHDNDMKNQVLS